MDPAHPEGPRIGNGFLPCPLSNPGGGLRMLRPPRRREAAMNNAVVIVLAVALIAAIGVAVWLYMQKRRTETLRSDFGPEYDRALHEHRDQREAERELEHRRERVEHLNIQPLPAAERDRFADQWQ